jgi:ABC-type dipeptide/oligopeptide/nickel transport system ATPase component
MLHVACTCRALARATRDRPKTKELGTSASDGFLKAVTHECLNELTQLFGELTQLFSLKSGCYFGPICTCVDKTIKTRTEKVQAKNKTKYKKMNEFRSDSFSID